MRHLIAVARAWRDDDPDELTRADLDALIADASGGDHTAIADLTARFATRLQFGTAGLRGELGAGPTRMNRVLVTQAAAGLAAYLLAQGTGGAAAAESSARPSIVIGYDGRTNSRVFAIDTAEIMAGAGVRAILLPRLLPTPVLAFAVRHLDVSAGVMVTASHNPAADNGYKVYLGGLDAGSQIVPPVDGAIAAHIERVAEGSTRDLPRSTDYEIAGEEVLDEYVRLTAEFAASPQAPVSVVYTPMHGVGWETARRVFVDAGFGEPAVVTEQITPDAAFPTVVFPNPEEPGALDLAIARGIELDAELIIANDPDADRLAIAIPVGTARAAIGPGGVESTPAAPGEAEVPATAGSSAAASTTESPAAATWRRLSGNEVGALLGWRAAERLYASDSDGTLAASIVSSPALKAVATEYRLDYADTLTGFKWISRVGGLAFGYEEALGYLVDPKKVRDKDGISAAVDFLSLVSELKAAGKTVDDHLSDFADKFGAFASSQISLRVADLADIPRIMAELRRTPPSTIGAARVASIDDFADGFGSFGPSDILRIWMDDGARVIVRPSGTEPKLKVYIDASSTTGTAAERRAAAEKSVAELDAGMRALIA
ncbi:phospho-sugar mutase [Glaciihabitans sp. dw_435]|uniref:phospho-sugar mutase n=1 Tax=Glaciihabitans sp. dw_435 TaxID=2720081 RepID=UPI001BD2CABE|nr:phospho-sugar mutase [Glaciihabitans sp. dw_435]